MSSTTLPQFRRSLGWVGLGFVLGALAGFAAFWWQFHKQARSDNSSVTIDWKAIYRMNNLGVGYMEQCDYPQAIKSFEKVGELAPDWLPGKINLGIALIHSRGTEKEIPRARFLFEEIVKRDSNNPYAHFCWGCGTSTMATTKRPETTSKRSRRLILTTRTLGCGWGIWKSPIPIGH